VNRLVRLFGTSIGRELIMAVTGALLLGFVVVHMLGNMKVFQGPQALNSYAAWLAGHPLLWFARICLLTIFVAHVYTGISLALENRAARPRRYLVHKLVEASFASRYMMLSGALVLAFVIYHLLHFTFGAIGAEHHGLLDADRRHDVYSMMVLGFRDPWITGSYVVAMLLLGLHLLHGASSVLQSLGINHDSYNALLWTACTILVLVIVVGNCSIPLVIYFGAVQLPGAAGP
jgi:succinate dehydrogenase / fumarate reductase cytochrome b subunit